MSIILDSSHVQCGFVQLLLIALGWVGLGWVGLDWFGLYYETTMTPVLTRSVRRLFNLSYGMLRLL